jgi:hypothetical protein
VAEVFALPFAHVADPARYRIEGRRWRGSDRRYYVVPWGPLLHLGRDRAHPARAGGAAATMTRVAGDWLDRPATRAVLGC